MAGHLLGSGHLLPFGKITLLPHFQCVLCIQKFLGNQHFCSKEFLSIEHTVQSQVTVQKHLNVLSLFNDLDSNKHTG